MRRPLGQVSAQTGALALILACQLMIVLDSTVMYTALPNMLAQLSLSRAGLSWVQNAYLLTFGGFLLLGARTGDILGHRRVFMAANALFVGASTAGGLALSANWLIAARAVQGFAGAFAAPSALALLLILFAPGAARVRAISLHTAVSGGGSALGLVLGGILTSYLSWRGALFINVPIGLVLLGLSRRYLPAIAPRAGRFDLPGALTATLGTGLMVYGLVQSAHASPAQSGALIALLTGAGLLAAFVWIEKRASQPIVPLALFDNAQRSGAYACKTLLIGGMLGTFFHLTLFVQEGLGFSAIEAGLAFLPLSLTQFLVVIHGVPRLLPRLGGPTLLAGGLALALAGMLWLSQVDPDTRFFPDLALAIVMLGAGTGAALVPLATAGVASVAPGDAGAASGLINVTHYLGGALGTAALVFAVHLTRPSAVGNDPSPWAAKLVHADALAVSAAASALFFALALGIVLLTMRREVLTT